MWVTFKWYAQTFWCAVWQFDWAGMTGQIHHHLRRKIALHNGLASFLKINPYHWKKFRMIWWIFDVGTLNQLFLVPSFFSLVKGKNCEFHVPCMCQINNKLFFHGIIKLLMKNNSENDNFKTQDFSICDFSPLMEWILVGVCTVYQSPQKPMRVYQSVEKYTKLH